MVIGIRDEDVAGSVDLNILRVVQLGDGSRTTITRKSLHTSPSNRRNNTCRAHTANPAIPFVGDEDVAGSVDPNTCRAAQLGGGGRTTITRKPLYAIP